MFALLAMAGDIGGAIGPGIIGGITERMGDNLQAGMLFAVIYPAVLVISVIMINFRR